MVCLCPKPVSGEWLKSVSCATVKGPNSQFEKMAEIEMSGEVDKERNVIMAKIAEQAERYEEMANYMKEIIKSGVELDAGERNLFSVAYKNVIGAGRASWRVVSSIEKSASGLRASLAKTYMEHIRKELYVICDDVLNLIDNFLCPEELLVSKQLSQKGEEDVVFYMKMKGDYCRYKAEIAADEDKEKARCDALESYSNAKSKAKDLKPTDPVRLGLLLNFSVFYYELCNDPKKACKLAKSAFDDAIEELDSLSEDTYKDSTLIMQLLRDNLTLWTSEMQGEDDAQIEDLEDAN